MELKPTSNIWEYIQIIDNVMNKQNLNIFLKICEERKEFEDGYITGNGNQKIKDLTRRNVKIWHPNNISGSMTEAHWTGFLIHMFKKKFNNYIQSISEDADKAEISEIQILKYTTGGHYKFHTDMGPSNPRSLSLIYFVNSDYEGGDLCFKDLKNNQELTVEKKENRLIIWPSNFMYPHAVKPITKGTRYSVVSWAV